MDQTKFEHIHNIVAINNALGDLVGETSMVSSVDGVSFSLTWQHVCGADLLQLNAKSLMVFTPCNQALLYLAKGIASI